MVTVLQILLVLGFIVLIILFVFQPRRAAAYVLPENFRDLLNDYVAFYTRLDDEGKKRFEERLQKFLSAVKITGANADVEDLDKLLIGAAAVIPIHFIRDWEYLNLHEVIVYPGRFNTDYEQHGHNRMISGMVGTGNMENMMILSKWELRQGFLHSSGVRNTAIHEFVHLIDKMDGTLDGVPEILLERSYVPQWKALLEETMMAISNGGSDIDAYGATGPVECFAVMAEYYFMQPEEFATKHPALAEMMRRIFVKEGWR